MAIKTNRQETLADDSGKTFKVGDGVHWGFNGDRYPGTILFVSDSGREVYVSQDEYEIIDNLGGYVEGDRKCNFTTIQRPIAECKVFKLGKWGFREGGKRGWALCKERAYAQNPSF